MPRRTKAEAEATRTALLDAAERLFAARGVSRTTLAQIAAEAGVTRGAVYWHFQDKADLFAAMMARVRLPMEAAAAQLEASPGPEPLARLRAWLLDTLARVAADPQVHRVFEIALHKVEYTGDGEVLLQRRRQAAREHLATIDRTLRRGGADPALALTLHALVVGLIHAWMLDPRAFDLVAEGRRALDACFSVHGAPAAPAPSGPARSRPARPARAAALR